VGTPSPHQCTWVPRFRRPSESSPRRRRRDSSYRRSRTSRGSWCAQARRPASTLASRPTDCRSHPHRAPRIAAA
jgi:hypothetical protein